MLLFLLFFNGAFLFLAVVFWHEKLDVQKEMALSEHYMILTSAARDMQALDSRGNGGNYNMEELMQPIHSSGRTGTGRFICIMAASCCIPMKQSGQGRMRRMRWRPA